MGFLRDVYGIDMGCIGSGWWLSLTLLKIWKSVGTIIPNVWLYMEKQTMFETTCQDWYGIDMGSTWVCSFTGRCVLIQRPINGHQNEIMVDHNPRPSSVNWCSHGTPEMGATQIINLTEEFAMWDPKKRCVCWFISPRNTIVIRW